MSEMSLSMRVPSVAPREADAVGSLKVCRGGTAVGETREEGGGFNLGCTPYTLVDKEQNTFFFQDKTPKVFINCDS